jgi:CelD/BcsL family acetyltransferase involved in cellulose biosynthesis
MLTYDPAWAPYSPGAAICDALIMWACDHGARRVDVLRGAEAHKFRYQPESEPLQTLVISHGAIGRACVSAYRLGVGYRKVPLYKTTRGDYPRARFRSQGGISGQ